MKMSFKSDRIMTTRVKEECLMTEQKVREAMDQMSEKFKELGGQIYLKAGE